jgi:hypothetical protein
MKINKKNTASVLNKAKAMVAGIGGNPTLFTNPNPALSAIQAQIAVVDKAEVVAGTRAHGSAAARNVQRGILVGMLETQQTTVQGVADASATPEEAISTIEAAGLSVAQVASYAKAILAVTQGSTPGTVALSANATALGAAKTKKSFFNWEYTADGKTFIAMPSTPKSKTSLTGLTPLSTYGFRVAVTDADGVLGPWSQIVSFLVH